MQFISEDQLVEALDRRQLVEALRLAFSKNPKFPKRHHHTIPRDDEDATLLLMPAWMENGPVGIKMVTVFPSNAKKSLPSIFGTYSLLDGETGIPLASMDGRIITLFRTAATSVLAATYLAPKSASKLLMVGTGALAPHIIATYVAVLGITEVSVWGRSFDKAKAIADLFDSDALNCKIAPVESLETAAGWADIISCATLSKTPLIKGEWLTNETFVDLIGSYTPEMREVDDETIRRATLFVDTREGALTETGDIMIPIQSGIIQPSDLQADLFDLTQHLHPGRRSKQEITLFKSTGYALEDLVAAQLAYEAVR